MACQDGFEKIFRSGKIYTLQVVRKIQVFPPFLISVLVGIPKKVFANQCVYPNL